MKKSKKFFSVILITILFFSISSFGSFNHANAASKEHDPFQDKKETAYFTAGCYVAHYVFKVKHICGLW